MAPSINVQVSIERTWIQLCVLRHRVKLTGNGPPDFHRPSKKKYKTETFITHIAKSVGPVPTSRFSSSNPEIPRSVNVHVLRSWKWMEWSLQHRSLLQPWILSTSGTVEKISGSNSASLLWSSLLPRTTSSSLEFRNGCSVNSEFATISVSVS